MWFKRNKKIETIEIDRLYASTIHVHGGEIKVYVYFRDDIFNTEKFTDKLKAIEFICQSVTEHKAIHNLTQTQ